MPTRALYRAKTPGLVGTANAAPIYVDSDDNLLKVIPAGTGTTEVVVATTGSAVTPVAGTNVKIASGTGTLDGGNPTTIATGLTTVTAFTATLIDTAGVGAGTAFLTHGAPVAGAVDVYAWVVAGTASTGTETFSWIAVGS